MKKKKFEDVLDVSIFSIFWANSFSLVCLCFYLPSDGSAFQCVVVSVMLNAVAAFCVCGCWLLWFNLKLVLVNIVGGSPVMVTCV